MRVSTKLSSLEVFIAASTDGRSSKPAWATVFHRSRSSARHRRECAIRWSVLAGFDHEEGEVREEADIEQRSEEEVTGDETGMQHVDRGADPPAEALGGEDVRA
jgi:hypothetical protein